MGAKVHTNLLFGHAILGCDTISQVHVIGNAAALKKVSTSPPFSKQAAVFTQGVASKSEIVAAGEKALIYLYNGKEVDSLDELHVLKILSQRGYYSTNHNVS